MAETTERADAWVERANEMYWSSPLTVDAIVEELGISRSSLYASLEPVSAGLVCMDCRERMVFSNRTARERGTAECPGCGMRSEHVEGTGGYDGGDQPTDMQDQEDQPRFSGWRGELAGVAPERVVMVGGAAALGMMVGAVATRALRGGR